MITTIQKSRSHLTLIDAIREQSVNNPEGLAYACISSDGTLQSTFTYSELISRAESVAVELLRFCDPGDRAMLLFHGGSEFIISFFGCLIAGVIPVPGYPVRVPASSTQPARNFARLVPIISNAQPKVALTTRAVVARQAELSAAEPIFSTLKWIAVEEIPDQRLESRPHVTGTNLAFLQYTSGSTSSPKGVMVSHNNLISVLRDMDASWPHDHSSVMVTWAPVFHDMGLIHGILFPLYFGFPVYTLSAASVLQQPRRWLEAITNVGGTHSSGPNFILDLCLKRISEHEMMGLNLSTLSALLTGAEPVRHKTLHQFQERFALCGLQPNAIQPGYGLAEFTLKVSATDVGSTPRIVHLDAAACEQGRVILRNVAGGAGTRSFVSCGWTHVGSDIRIVDPKSRTECQPDEIGEIWVSGDNLTRGYWANSEATEETMRARLIDGRGPYLRTGDLGFVIDRGLYIAGRLKDLIIIRGRNLHPDDLENTIEESLPEVRGGRCCAFSVDREQGEALVVVAEIDRVQRHNFDAANIFARLREGISVQHEAELFDAVLVRTGTFPLTSSGKVQRKRACQEYLDGTLQSIARIREPEPPADSSTNGEYEGQVAEVRTRLIEYLSTKLHQPAEKLSTKQSFQRLGLDSLSLIEMVLDLEAFCGQPLETSIVFEQPCIEDLSVYVAARIRLASAAAPASIP